MHGDGQRKDCYRIAIALTTISHVSAWVPDLCKEILVPYSFVLHIRLRYDNTHSPTHTHTYRYPFDLCLCSHGRGCPPALG